MRTVCGLARDVQRLVGQRGRQIRPIASVRPLAGGRRPLLTGTPGPQRRGGAVLDQVDGTTCGSAVLVALAAWADPAELDRLDGDAVTGVASGSLGAAATAGIAVGFGGRFDARQLQVHRESTRFWPPALGTSPWGMVAWLRRHAPGAGPYRVRLVDDCVAADVAAALAAVAVALSAGRPVPLLIGTFVPRHYVMALGADGPNWRVYEPTSGEVRTVDPQSLAHHATAAQLGFDRLHAVLLPT